ncbi:MAG TPA: aminotransferase class V-fold PLP-dependent enzyme [Candidatus Polarisedimenticolia bacterium]|nr:aminotransferase class V-fold PLP-dependent enzyme [Candidatus Polarisedimenticolia bacterium]
MPGGSPWAGEWTLDPAVRYLNHGSFGACPRSVLDHQSLLRARLEREPVDFMARELPALLSEARAALGSFIGADPAGIVFVPNVTTAVNAALRSWDLRPGDEILVNDHNYNACRRAAAFVAARRGARAVSVPVPFPLSRPGEVLDALLSAVTPRTRVALLDHVTSPTALVLPIEPIVTALRERGVETIVDGAHALGMVPIDLDRLGAACYTANAHKWLCAPKGSAMLHVRADLRSRIRPLVAGDACDLSQGLRFRKEWDWTGTDDPTPALSIPECLRFMAGLLPGGWPEVLERNHRLAVQGRAIVLDALGVAPPCPETMLGSMASVPLPAAAPASPVALLDQDALAAWTRARGIETWFFPWPAAPGGKLVRLSAQLYNHEDEYRMLASLLREALHAG